MQKAFLTIARNVSKIIAIDMTCIKYYLALLLITLSGGWSATVSAQPGQPAFKWYQPPQPTTIAPTNLYYGWNEVSAVNEYNQQNPQIAADDWVCTNANPVTGIRWWGSFMHWQSNVIPPGPLSFVISIWTDVPVFGAPQMLPFSHPGQVVWQTTNSSVNPVFAGWDFDPMSQTYEACFKFEVTLDQAEWFYQQTGSNGANIYWVSVAAVYSTFLPVTNPFGWKTRPRATNSLAPDAAVRIMAFDPPMLEVGSQFSAGDPLWWPERTNSWDLAFELVSKTGGGLTKWVQSPDLTSFGIDVNATRAAPGPFLLANDWLCTNSGYVTDIGVWGSWTNDILPGTTPSPTNVIFTLSIHADIPPGNPPYFQPYSMPGALLWSNTFMPGKYLCVTQATQLQEGWMNPPEQYTSMGDHTCYRYLFNIDPTNAFFQEGSLVQPTIYWLDVQAFGSLGTARFGWKTSSEIQIDSSAWVRNVEGYSGVWTNLIYPPGHQYYGWPL